MNICVPRGGHTADSLLKREHRDSRPDLFEKKKKRIETNVAFADAQSRVNFLSSVGACATVENFHLPFMTAEKKKKKKKTI